MTQQPLAAYCVRDTGDKPFWTRIGSAYANKNGFTLLLEAFPASDLGQYRIVVLQLSDKVQAKSKAKAKRQQQ